jgi:hypothetical protein
MKQDKPGRSQCCGLRPTWSAVSRTLAITWLVLFGCGARAAESAGSHLPLRAPGGLPARPIITGLSASNENLSLTWRGFGGPYQVLQKGDLQGAWRLLGAPTEAKTALLPGGASQGFFSVAGPAPLFAGATNCMECHRGAHDEEAGTAHFGALGTLKQIGQEKNAACLPCHTVGYGLPTGFKDEATTPHLAGVQCENCHGPAALHAANPADLTAKPLIELSAKLCGGCHTGAHYPTYEEWEGSGHAEVVEDMNPASRISSCGRCHSGSARMSMLKGDPLPTGDANVGIVCVTCHDPHKKTASRAQLRNPTSSTNFFSLATSAVFSNVYNASIQICAQCHNARGAAWTDTSRPPHHSPQYNVLLGNIGVITNRTITNAVLPAVAMSPHWRLVPDQCASCHVQSRRLASPTEQNPNVTGHGFGVAFLDVCYQCHDDPEWKMEATQEHTRERIQAVKASLDLWASAKAPAALRAKYGPLGWEYSTPGQLSNPAGTAGISGPTAAEQTNSVPAGIRQARFNLYLVEHDASYGAHNAAYARHLLKVAEGLVKQELDK